MISVLDLVYFAEIRGDGDGGSLFPSCKYPSAFTYGPIKANSNLEEPFPSLQRTLKKEAIVAVRQRALKVDKEWLSLTFLRDSLKQGH